jgi:hypothetical protein
MTCAFLPVFAAWVYKVYQSRLEQHGLQCCDLVCLDRFRPCCRGRKLLVSTKVIFGEIHLLSLSWFAVDPIVIVLLVFLLFMIVRQQLPRTLKPYLWGRSNGCYPLGETIFVQRDEK